MIKAKFGVDYSLYKKKMGLLGTQLVPYAKITTQQLADIALAMIKQKTGRVTSGATELRDLWEMDHNRIAAREEFIIHNTYPNQDVILWREVGTKPHDIVPKNKKFLHFFIGFHEIFTKHVWHPGTRPHLMILETNKFIKKKMEWWEKQIFKQADRIERRSH
jgi:hypothetical protein